MNKMFNNKLKQKATIKLILLFTFFPYRLSAQISMHLLKTSGLKDKVEYFSEKSFYVDFTGDSINLGMPTDNGTVYRYNKDGFITQKEIIDSEKSLCTISFYSWDTLTRRVYEKIYNTFSYDEISEEWTLNPIANNFLLKSFYIEYDTLWNMRSAQVINYSKNDTTIYYAHHTYSKTGKILIRRDSSNTNLLADITYSKYEVDNISEEITMLPDGSVGSKST